MKTTKESAATEVASAPASIKVVKSAVKQAFLEPILAAGSHDSKELVEALKTAFPIMTEVTIRTLVIDLKNEKYSLFKDRKIVKGEDGKLKFA